MSLNLFSMFDPSTSNFFSLNWMSILLPIFLWPLFYWNFNSRIFYFMKITHKFLNFELKKNMNKMNYMNLIIILTMFWFIFINNFLSLLPYIFSSSSHLTFSLNFALMNWLTFMLFGWTNNYNKMFTHLVPENTPMFLSFFMVLIETTSNLIRPITLSVRLSANMTAGHILLSLISSLSETSWMLFMPSLPLILSLILLEMAVSLIQSYVFFTLISLYMNEI